MDHLNPDSDLKCKSIPEEDLAGVNTCEEKKRWTSAAIKYSDVAVPRGPNPQDVYIGDTEFTIDQLIEKAYEYSIGFQGKYYVAVNIKRKLKKRQVLTPEERKINYRPIAVRNQQKRVLDHIFGDRSFKLNEIDEVCRWMKTTEDEEKFMSSRLIAVNKEIGKDKPLSISTINTFAMAMTVLLKYIIHEYKDDDVQKAAMKAMESVKNIARTASKYSRITTERRGYEEKENYLVPLEDLAKFMDSDVHKTILGDAHNLYKIKDEHARMKVTTENYGRRQIFDLQCHLAVLLMMHTGK